MEVEQSVTNENQQQERSLIVSVLSEAVEMNCENLKNLGFQEDVEEKSGRDRFVLTHLNDDSADAPTFFVQGTIDVLAVTPGGAVQSRKAGYKTRLDEYNVSINVEDESRTRPPFDSLLQNLKDTRDALPTISFASGLIEKKKDFENQKNNIRIKVSGISGSVVYFNRKVTKRGGSMTKEQMESLPKCFQEIPKQGQNYQQLEYPGFMELVPMIPSIDSSYHPVDVSSITTPRRGKVFFEVVQGCCNFRTNNEHVRQITLIPSVVAVMVEPEAALDARINSLARVKKRRRLGC